MHDNILGPAPLWRRLAAMFYDSFLVFAIWMIVGYLVLLAFGIEETRTLEGEQVHLAPLFRWVTFGAMLLSSYVFFAWFWTHSGQTLGMQAWKIRIQNADGSAIDWRQSLIRYLAAPPSLLLLGIGYLSMYGSPDRQSVPDRLSRSRVVVLRHHSRPAGNPA